MQQVLREAPDPSWTSRLRRTISRPSEAIPRVAQVDIGGAAVVLTDHELVKDKYEVRVLLHAVWFRELTFL